MLNCLSDREVKMLHREVAHRYRLSEASSRAIVSYWLAVALAVEGAIVLGGDRDRRGAQGTQDKYVNLPIYERRSIARLSVVVR